MKIKVYRNEDLVGLDDKIIEAAWSRAAQSKEEDEEIPLTASAISEGAAFKIPLLVPEEHPTGDNRFFKKNSLSVRDLPIPLLWQIQTDDGHKGSVIVGRIDRVERVGPDEEHYNEYNGLGEAYGVFDTGVFGREAERLVRNGFLRWVSVDLDQFEATIDDEPATELADGEIDEDAGKRKIKNDRTVISAARATAATLVAKPAFQEVKIHIIDPLEDEWHNFTPEIIEDGIYMDKYDDDEEYDLASIVASAAPVVPPRSWFKNPELDGPTPLTVEDDGRVFGHIALWNSDHIGMAGRVKPPRSRSGYAYFRTGVVRCDDGTDVPVGQLTLVGGHASLSLSAEQAKQHYDDTRSGVVDVAAGEDRYGIWVAGSLRPDVTPEQVRVLRASALSGDWRPIDGRLELVAVCSVPVPGFPNPRAMVAGGQVQALVAAGAAPLMEMRKDTLEQRLADLEAREFERETAEARAKIDAFAAEALTASAEDAWSRLSEFTNEVEEERRISYQDALKRLGLE